jgi:hypothetical protein
MKLNPQIQRVALEMVNANASRNQQAERILSISMDEYDPFLLEVRFQYEDFEKGDGFDLIQTEEFLYNYRVQLALLN